MTRLAIAKLESPRVAPLGNLVKADAYRVIVEADRALARADEQSQRAYEAAVAAGRAAGEAEGRRASAALTAEVVAAVRDYARRAEQRLADIVTEAVRRIIGEFDDGELVLGMVRQLLRDAQGEATIRLHVSPRHYPRVRDAARELQAEFDAVAAIDVAADPEVADDGCRMETPLGFVNASIAEQLDALRAAFAPAVAERDG